MFSIIINIISSLYVGLKYLFKPKVTINYPNETNVVSTRFCGEHFFALDDFGKDKCTNCKLCEKICPTNTIKIYNNISLHLKQTEFHIDEGKCIYCGLCTEICPVGAMKQKTKLNPATSNKEELIFNRNKHNGKN